MDAWNTGTLPGLRLYCAVAGAGGSRVLRLHGAVSPEMNLVWKLSLV